MAVSAASLQAGQDYPRTLGEFSSWFHDEAECLAYLELLRWPTGFICPKCGAQGEPLHIRRSRLRCRACRSETSVIAGTIFADTKLPLTIWFQTIWLVTNQKHGTSALDIQRQTGVSYETAWTMLHKLRRTMVREDRGKLDGVIEVDETYVGGVAPGSRGRGALGKVIVAIAVERFGVSKKYKKVAFGRVRLQRVPNVKKPTLTKFVVANCKTGAEIRTDHWVGYDGLKAEKFKHVQTSISSTGDPAHVYLPGVHMVASQLKRWLMGTHQGAVGVHQVDYYLDEFVFRWNRRRSANRGLVFYRLLEQALVTEPNPASEIIGGSGK